LPDGSKEYLNKCWYDYTGLTLEQGKGWGWKVVVHPDDLDRLIREWLALVNARKPGELETRIRRYDGEYRWFLICVVPRLDADGNLVRWFGSNTDIEDRKRAEKKLLEDERELRRITDAIPQAIVVQDPSCQPNSYAPLVPSWRFHPTKTVNCPTNCAVTAQSCGNRREAFDSPEEAI
jgi:formate hydrogenlyase transcriptional activator